MEVKSGVKEMLELVEGVKEMAIIAKLMMKDKKVSFEDLHFLPQLLEKQEVLLKAFSGLSQLDDELKDIDVQEAMLVMEALISAAKEVEAAD